MRISHFGAVVIGMVALVLLTACGGVEAIATSTPTANAPQATATPVPPTPEPTPTAPVAATPTPTGGVDDGHLVVLGKVLFDVTAGGIGCAYCHQADAMGDVSVGSPDIRSVTEAQIWDALETRAQMTFMTLTNDEVRAVAAYLGTFSK